MALVSEDWEPLIFWDDWMQGQAPDLTQFGDSASNPLFTKDVDADKVRKVEVVGGKLDANVKGEVNATVTNTVPVEGQVDINGTVNVNVLNNLSARLGVDLGELYVALYGEDMGLEADGVAPGFGGG